MSELHLRGVSTALAILDETLCAFEHWASGREDHGVLYHEQNPLSPKEREAILSTTRQIREELRELRDKLGLEPKVQDVASSIWAWCCTIIEPVQELEGRYLRRYGEPPAELVQYLDPKVAKLCDLLGTVQQIASRARGRPTPPARPKARDGEHLVSERKAREKDRSERREEALRPWRPPRTEPRDRTSWRGRSRGTPNCSVSWKRPRVRMGTRR